MNIRSKLLAIVAVSIATGLIVIYYSISSIMLKNFLDIENRYADNRVGGVARSFVQICEDFSNKMNDWATWDDSYNFMADRNRRFIESNITYESMSSLELDFMFFVGASDEIVLDCSFDHVNKRINPAAASVKKSVIGFAGSLGSAVQKTSMAGLFSLESRPALIASNLILTSTGAGPSRGYIIYGHYIDNAEIARISKLTGLGLAFEKVRDHDKSHPEVCPDFNSAGLKYSCDKFFTPDSVSCLITVNCVAGRPLFTVKFSEPRVIYNQAVAAVGYFILALLVSGAVFFILAIYLIDRFFAQRIVKLSAEVKGISLENDNHRRVSKDGADEISALASQINLLLENIEGSHKEMKKLVAELDAAARAKSDFIGNIGHELRTPITCIIGYADILADMVAEGEPREFVNRIKLSAHMLISTVNDILDHISLEGGELKLNSGEFGFGEVFDEIIGYAKFIAEEKKLVFNARIDKKLSGMRVVGDQTRLKQVVLNLAGNALKFTSAGFIEIGADISGETESDVDVRVSVKDSGIGVSDEKRAEIFLPFVQGDNSSTRKYGGSGLGLTIAGNLVRLMGGEKIKLESRSGEGSNFYFNVKLIKA